ncbi:stage III sporulation protein AF [Virgibacillus sp. MSP4-1]|uniref:stage III sporulation protein AF n=1 Tax=Virgibacillus sp. MSP4-1 TaxID=2700081 RepID=UPI00039C6BA2|nr:stage III sporulation protein AF [Virgibacillus sp. MSP4-1]QHS22724.1 stage III sporulation protein AF [Virgibacillus sp. MSP4-1]
MSYIQDWVTEIIIFILIAMIVDLLMPQSSMQKYVRFAVGMILVLIFLQPLFHVFNANPSKFLQNELLSGSNESEQLEKEIENQKIDIQASQRAYILNQIAQQLKTIAEEELIKKYGVMIQDIKFTFPDQSEEVNWENIKMLSVAIERSEETENQEIREVDVDIDEKPATEEKLPIEDIKNDLSSFWEISKDKISIIGEGGNQT